MDICGDKFYEHSCSLEENHIGLHKDELQNVSWQHGSQLEYDRMMEEDLNEAYKSLDLLADEFVRTAKSVGFYAEDKIYPAEDIAKCHEELSELYQVISKGTIHAPSDKMRDMDHKMNGKWLTAAQEEAADIIIQNIKIIGWMKKFLGINSIAEIVKFKNEYNGKREWKHGNK